VALQLTRPRADVLTVRWEIRMSDLVNIAISADAQLVAEALGLRVSRSVTSGTQVRQLPREHAEIAVVCLRDWGFTARILEDAPRRDAPIRVRR
jgi:hypothetical protein